jgi:hypothetical protein
MMPPTHFANSVRNHLDTAFWDHWFGHMAMCGNHIQRVKIVINNIIEQVTYFRYKELSTESVCQVSNHTQCFRYLGYCISEYKSNIEDKLKTYNKINGAIWRHFGKQMNKETKLRIYNV